MKTLLNDLKYAARTQAKDPGTLMSVLILALALGATTAVFSLVDTIMLKPLPYADSERIVLPWRLAPKNVNLGYSEIPWGAANFQRIARDSKTLQEVSAFKPDIFNLTGVGEPALCEGVRVSAQFLQVLRVSPLIGRGFTAAEDQPGQGHEVILGYDLWQQRFQGDSRVNGHTVNLNGAPYTVIGVMPAGFAFPIGEEMPGSFGFPHRAQLWVPLALPPIPPSDALDDLAVIGRMTDGVTLARVQAEMNLFATRMERADPSSPGWYNSRVTPLTRQVAGDTRTPLLLILLAVGVLLAVTCSNVANLLLTRSLGRSSEFALRAALGAGPGRLLRQLLTESLFVAVLGGAIGVMLADFALHLVKDFGPSNLPRLQEVALNPRIFAFAFGATVLNGLFFGLAPALMASRRDLSGSLRVRSQAGEASSNRSKLRNALFVSQFALALVLAIASGLLAQTFVRLLRVDPGFHAESVLTFELSLPASKYGDNDRIVALYQKALERFRAIPGVQSAGLAEMAPMDGATDGTVIRIPGKQVPKGANLFANYTIASPGYFSAVGTPLLRGRDFLNADANHSTPVAIINQSMAKTFWPRENALGKQIGLGNPDFPLMTVVGIVADVKHLSLRETPGPEMYVPFTQNPFPSMAVMHVVLRYQADSRAVMSSVRTALRSVDAQLPIAKAMPLQAIVDRSMAGQRFSMVLVSAFAALSLLLAAFGLYGVISHSVGQRTYEIGIRLALGAERRTVLNMFLCQGIRSAVLGIAIGLITAAFVTRLLAGFLFGVQPGDAGTFVCVPLFLALVALLATYLPARRAMHVDPMIILRQM